MKQAEPVTNASAFMARLLVREDSQSMSMAWWADWILSNALENNFDDNFGISEADVYVPGAAAFMDIAAHRVHGMCIGDENSTSPLSEGENRLTRTRWMSWKARFAELSTMDGVADESQKAAQRAYAFMEEADIQRRSEHDM